MDDYVAALSSIVSDRVRYYELVKITVHTSTRKSYILVADKNIFLVTFNLGGVIKNSKIEYKNIKEVTLDRCGTKITLKFHESLVPSEKEDGLEVKEVTVETPDYTTLYHRIKIALDTDYMIKNFEEPKEEDETQVDVNDTILPFYKFKKITFGGYYFFLRKSFKDTTFNTMYSRRYEDDRGVTLTVNIKEPFPAYSLEQDELFDLYNYTRRFIEEVKLSQKPLEFASSDRSVDEDRKFYEVLRDEIYYKKMNLNEDISKWSCYHILLRTEDKFIAYFILRRLFIPPLLDSCQDLLIRFDLVLTPNSMSNICNYWNEFCLVVNSFTSCTSHFTWNKDLIELRLNNLRFKNEMYKHLKIHFNILPSYFNFVKGFIVSLLRLLPIQSVDQYIIYKLNENVDVYSDEPLEYVYQIVHYLFGPNYKNQVIVNKFIMRLADFITYTMDELVIGNELLLKIVMQNLTLLEPPTRKKVDNVLMFLMHFRNLNFNEKYNNNTFNNIFNSYYNPHKNPDDTHKEDRSLLKDKRKAQKNVDWPHTTFNYYATSRLLEEGYLNILFDSEEVEDNGYILLICTLIEKFNDYSLHKRIIRNMLQLPIPLPEVYLPMIPSLIQILNSTTNENLIVLVLSLLINFSFHNDKSKELMINNNISFVLNNFLLLQNECLMLSLKLILNLTKTKLHQLIFIRSGLLYSLINILQKYCNCNNDHIELIAHVAAIIGHLYNANIHLQFHKLDYIVDVMLYVYVNYKGTVQHFNNILFCISKVIDDRRLSLKVGRQLTQVLLMLFNYSTEKNGIIQNLSHVKDNNYIINIFGVLLKLADFVPNCLIMKENNVSKILEELDLKIDIIVQFSIKLANKIKKKTIHCNI